MKAALVFLSLFWGYCSTGFWSNAAPVYEPLSGFEAGPVNPGGEGFYLQTDGNFYGTSEHGGFLNYGTIFRVTPAGQVQTLVQMSETSGTSPGKFTRGRLIADGQGFLWGTSYVGGENDGGSVYKINLTTLEFIVIHSFNGGNTGEFRGGRPEGGLTPDGAGYFWGAAPSGGTGGAGLIFKVHIATGVYSIVADFNPAAGTGRNPYGALVPDAAGNFWGASADSIYKINKTTGVITTLVKFTGTSGPVKGTSAGQPLTADGNGFYWGVTQAGGDGNFGTVYKINATTGAFTSLVSFTNSTTGSARGENPQCRLVRDGLGFLWGTTVDGGANGLGTIFKMNIATGAITTVVDLTGSTGSFRGQSPFGGLTDDGKGWLWGYTYWGGATTVGTVFKINYTTGAFVTMTELADNGATAFQIPTGALAPDASNQLWGTAEAGGTGNFGGIYKLNPATKEITPVLSFTGTAVGNLGSRPVPGLTPDGQGFFWGATKESGNAGNHGTVFKVNAATGVLTTLFAFTNTAGAFPGSAALTGLTSDGQGFMWGTTSIGGAGTRGTVYKVNILTGQMTSVVQFTGTTGATPGTRPSAQLFNDGNGFLWGSTYQGGTSDNGTIFKIRISTSEFIPVVQFTAAAPTIGSRPLGALVSDGSGSLLGVTERGGTSNRGTVFRLNAATGEVTTLVIFTGLTGAMPGTTPACGLVRGSGDEFWGATTIAGAANLGTIFKVTPSGAFASVLSFSGTGGAVPGKTASAGALTLQPDGNLIGCAREGGMYPGGPAAGRGQIYRLRLGPTVFTQPAVPTAVSAALQGTVNPNQVASAVSFEYGTNPALLTSTSVEATTTAAESVVLPISKTVTGLMPSTVYYFRIVGTSADSPNPQKGEIFSFQTKPNTAPTVQLTGAASVTIEAGSVYTDAGATVSDAEETLTPAITANTVAANIPGTYAVTWSVTDAWGLSGSVTRTVRVVDTTAPVVSHDDVTAEASQPGGATVNYLPASATDFIGVTNVTYSKISGTLFPLGDTTVTVTARDAAGNTGTGAFVVRVRDTTKAQLLLPAPPVAEAQNAQGATVAFAVSATDAVDGTPNIVATPASGSVFPIGSTRVDVSVTDFAGNVETGSFMVTVRDTTKPVVTGTFNPLTLATGPAGTVDLPNYLPQAIATDAVGVVSVTQDPAPGNARVAGTTTVTLTATDAAGNAVSFSFPVLVNDGTPPALDAPEGGFTPLTLVAGPKGTAEVPDYTLQAVRSDNVGVTDLTQSPAPGTARPPGSFEVTLLAVDAAGNQTSRKFDVLVVDTTVPVIEAPEGGFAPLTLVAGPVGTAEVPDYTLQAVRSDNVGVTEFTQSPAPGTARPPGRFEIALLAVDAAGNQTSRKFDILVVDTTVPVINAPAENFGPLALITGEDGTVALPDYTGQAVTSDNVGVVVVTQIPAAGNPRAAGTTTVTVTAADAAGNKSDIRFDVAIADGTKPSIAAPLAGYTPRTLIAGADGRAPLPDYTGQAVTADNVAVTSVVQSPAPGAPRFFGETTITLTAHDAAGNSREMTFSVYVRLDAALKETVAVSGGAVPGAGEDPRIPIDAKFKSFGLPAIDEQKQLVYLAKWTSPGSGAGTGIFSNTALVASVGEDAAGVAGTRWKTLQDPMVAPDGTLAFAGTMQGNGIKATNDFGVWLATPEGVTLILREGDQVPGAPAGVKLKAVKSASLRDDGLLATVTLLPAPGVVTAANDSALIHVTASGGALLLREGGLLTLENSSSVPIRSFQSLVPTEGSGAHGRWQADGSALAQVTLKDGRTLAIQLDLHAAAVSRVALGESVPAVNTSAYWHSFGVPAVETGGGAVVFRGVLKSDAARNSSDAISTKSDAVVAFGETVGGALNIVAREAGDAPGITGAKFTKFLDPLVNDAGEVAFVAGFSGPGISAKNNSALYWGPAASPAVQARLGAPAPDAFGVPHEAVWTKLLATALPDQSGPVFLAKLGGRGVKALDNVGLWAVDSDGIVRQIIRTGETVEGKRVTGIHALGNVSGSLAASRGFNSQGTIAARLAFPRGEQGIVRLNVPAGVEIPELTGGSEE